MRLTDKEIGTMERTGKHGRMWSLGVVLFLAIGCATNTKTVQTETTRYPAIHHPTTVEHETTVTTESEEGSGGIVSGTVDVVGEAISLPFRATGGLIRTIF